jgi:NosR/NirI family transcriptional regulator, nitrous oxide reductase regulator
MNALSQAVFQGIRTQLDRTEKPDSQTASLDRSGVAASRQTAALLVREGQFSGALPRRRYGVLVGVAVLLGFVLSVLSAMAEQRFPPPDFESGHKLPVTTTPPARTLPFQYLDVAVLAATLGVATWLVLKKRSRPGVVALSIFSVLYFGFWRKGCICSIGSVQNVALALADRSYALPLAVTAFFLLPLIFALFAGRVFCAGVCPHGALQDLVLLKPIKLPPWLEQGLSVLPFIVLGGGMLFAATGSAFLICQYDPFVPIFRMNGRILMVGAGVVLLGIGMFVGRPYCRFLCPYGALLKLGASVSKWRVRVTPDYCTECRLCEASCPFGAMREPQLAKTAPPELAGDRRRLTGLLLLLPLLLAGGAGLGWEFSRPAARVHPGVSLADRLAVQAEGHSPAAAGQKGDPASLRLDGSSAEALALARAQQSPQEIQATAAAIEWRFVPGSVLFGVWVGLVIGLKLISLSLRRARSDYEPDRGACVACARCFEYCPNELARRGVGPSVVAAVGAGPRV